MEHDQTFLDAGSPDVLVPVDDDLLQHGEQYACAPGEPTTVANEPFRTRCTDLLQTATFKDRKTVEEACEAYMLLRCKMNASIQNMGVPEPTTFREACEAYTML